MSSPGGGRRKRKSAAVDAQPGKKKRTGPKRKDPETEVKVSRGKKAKSAAERKAAEARLPEEVLATLPRRVGLRSAKKREREKAETQQEQEEEPLVESTESSAKSPAKNSPAPAKNSPVAKSPAKKSPAKKAKAGKKKAKGGKKKAPAKSSTAAEEADGAAELAESAAEAGEVNLNEADGESAKELEDKRAEGPADELAEDPAQAPGTESPAKSTPAAETVVAETAEPEAAATEPVTEGKEGGHEVATEGEQAPLPTATDATEMETERAAAPEPSGVAETQGPSDKVKEAGLQQLLVFKKLDELAKVENVVQEVVLEKGSNWAGSREPSRAEKMFAELAALSTSEPEALLAEHQAASKAALAAKDREIELLREQLAAREESSKAADEANKALRERVSELLVESERLSTSLADAIGAQAAPQKDETTESSSSSSAAAAAATAENLERVVRTYVSLTGLKVSCKEEQTKVLCRMRNAKTKRNVQFSIEFDLANNTMSFVPDLGKSASTGFPEGLGSKKTIEAYELPKVVNRLGAFIHRPESDAGNEENEESRGNIKSAADTAVALAGTPVKTM